MCERKSSSCVSVSHRLASGHSVLPDSHKTAGKCIAIGCTKRREGEEDSFGFPLPLKAKDRYMDIGQIVAILTLQCDEMLCG